MAPPVGQELGLEAPWALIWLGGVGWKVWWFLHPHPGLLLATPPSLLTQLPTQLVGGYHLQEVFQLPSSLRYFPALSLGTPVILSVFLKSLLPSVIVAIH